MGPATYTVSVKFDSGKVVGTVAGGMFPPATASEISLSGKNLMQYVLGDLQADDSQRLCGRALKKRRAPHR
jgi:hypothetical protein